MSAANMLNNGATRTDNGDGTFTWKFSGVFKADASGYLALYNTNGTLIFTTATLSNPHMMDEFNNIYLDCGKDGNYTGEGNFKYTNFKVTL